MSRQQTNNTSLKTIFLFSEKDVAIKEIFENHLKILRYDSNYVFASIEDFNYYKNTVKDYVQNSNVFVMLLSSQFAASRFALSNRLGGMIRAHNKRLIKIFPIHLETLDLSKNPLKTLARLDANQTAFDKIGVVSFNEMLDRLVHELIRERTRFERRIRRIELGWDKAKRANSSQGYNEFLEKFGLTKFSEEAKKLLDETIDREKWEKTLEKPDVKSFVNYLQKSPLKSHQEEVLSKITELENDGEVLYEDVKNSASLGLLFDFKMRFPGAEMLSEIDEKIVQIITGRFPPDKEKEIRFFGDHIPDEEWEKIMNDEEVIKTEGHGLNYLICENCTKQEAFNVGLFEQFARNLKQKLRIVAAQLDEKRSNFVFYTCKFPFYGSLLLTAMNYYFGIIEFSLIKTFLFELGNLFWFCFPLVLAAAIWIGREYLKVIKEEIAACASDLSEISKKLVQLKVTFLNHDLKKRKEIIEDLNETNDWATALYQKGFGDYFKSKNTAE